MTTYGIIGAGNIGSQIARAVIGQGDDVVIANSRGPETLADLIAELGPKARAATAQEAAEAADIAVLKVQPLGGVRACLRIAEDIGLPVVVSSALETSVGIATGLALAAALPELPYACGLATVQLLTDDVVAEPLLPVGGMLPIGRVEPDPELLARHEASADRREWWLDRLARCHALLAGAAI